MQWRRQLRALPTRPLPHSIRTWPRHATHGEHPLTLLSLKNGSAIRIKWSKFVAFRLHSPAPGAPACGPLRAVTPLPQLQGGGGRSRIGVPGAFQPLASLPAACRRAARSPSAAKLGAPLRDLKHLQQWQQEERARAAASAYTAAAGAAAAAGGESRTAVSASKTGWPHACGIVGLLPWPGLDSHAHPGEAGQGPPSCLLVQVSSILL